MRDHTRPVLTEQLGAFSRYRDCGGFRFISSLATPEGNPSILASAFSERAEASHKHQADGIFESLAELTEGAGGIQALARLHLYQQDKRAFPILETTRREWEGAAPAPSSGIGVAQLGDSSDTLWEIDGIALNSSGVERWGPRRSMEDMRAGRSASHYSQAIEAGPYYFLAGFIPIDVETGQVVSGYHEADPEDRWLATGRSHTDTRRGPIISQTASLIRRILAMIEDLGCKPSDIVFSTIYLENYLDAPDAVRAFKHIIGDNMPALQVVTVDEVGHKGTLIEIECTIAAEGDVERLNSPRTADVPLATSSAELAYISDQIGENSSGQLVRRLDRKSQVRLGASVERKLNLPDEFVAELMQAWDNFTDAIGKLFLTVHDLGMIYVQVKRPYGIRDVDAVLSELLNGIDVAGTIISVSGLGHHPEARVAIAGICGSNRIVSSA